MVAHQNDYTYERENTRRNIEERMRVTSAEMEIALPFVAVVGRTTYSGCTYTAILVLGP